MRTFWADPSHSTLYIIGKLLSVEAQGKTLADRVAEGEDLEMDSIAVAGRSLPLIAGFRISLKTLNLWGCPACGSAHGAGVYPSRGVNADLLGRCDFYYNPQTKVLFTISRACWKKYVEKLNAAGRFVHVPAVETETYARDKEGDGHLKAFEFEDRVTGGASIRLPPEVARQLPAGTRFKAILLVQGAEEDAWKRLGLERFSAAYSPEDVVYEKLLHEPSTR